MGTITSGVGLYSGLDYASLVDQLIAIDAAPRDQLEKRVGTIDAQKTAYTEISARISAMLARTTSLKSADMFRSVAVSSSNKALSATGSAGATPGSYTFRVRSLAQSHQLVSGGFRSTSATLGSGTISIESAQARVNNLTQLEALNGYHGVDRGSFTLLDGDGRSATVDITDARTLDDVVERINATGLNITAALVDEAITLTEVNGGAIEVREISGGKTAATLGFGSANRAGTGTLSGTNLMYLTDDSPLSALNDGLGIDRAAAGKDFKVNLGSHEVTVNLTDYLALETRLERLNHGAGVELGTVRISTRDGQRHEIDLSDARTIQDISDAINEGTDGDVAVVVSGNGLRLTDATSPRDADNPDATPFTVQDITGHAAKGLGLDEQVNGNRISGRDVLHMDTVGDVLAAINFAYENFAEDAPESPLIEARIAADGQRIELLATGNGTPTTFTLTAGTESKALADLGITAGTYDTDAVVTGRRVGGGVNTVLLSTLNGGNGVAGGSFTINSNGQAVTIDTSAAETLRDVVELINAHSDTLALTADYDPTGTRLELTRTGTNTGAVSIADVGDGATAAGLGLAGDFAAADRVRGANLQKQYMTSATRLDDLNGGQGIGSGTIRITDSNGRSTEINLSSGHDTLGDVIKAINEDGRISVTAGINATGDGLLLTDTGDGELAMTVENVSGTIGSDLHLVGEAVDGQIDGSFEFSLELDGSQTLADVAAAINENAGLASATILNDGSGISPYRLSVNATASGLAGELIIDAGDSDFNFQTLTQAQDARISYGDSEAGGVLITSATNTFNDVIDGLTLNVSSLTDEAVTISVNKDVETVKTAMAGLVKDFNSIMEKIDKYGDFDPETEKRGVLQGDSTLYAIENRLWDMMIGNPNNAAGTITRLSQIGIQTNGTGELVFNESDFLEAFESDPEAVIDFFTNEDDGRALYIKERIESVTESQGLITAHNESLTDQQDALNERIEQMNELLEAKRQRLLNQFIAMEQTLSQLQSQQSALAGIGSLSTGTSTTGAG